MSRHTDRSTVDASFTMTTLALLRPSHGGDATGTLTWTRQPHGDFAGRIGYRIATSDPDNAHVRLIYTADNVLVDDRIELERTACRFGGWRWWFACPVLGCRVAKLHLPPGGRRFASRRAWRLAYQNNRDTQLQSAHNRLRRLYCRLGAEYPYAPLDRPIGMHGRTYARLSEAIEAAEDRLLDVPFGRRALRLVGL